MTGNINLVQSFPINQSRELVAFIGGGGKSSLMFHLAGQLAGRVLLTTTTRMYAAQIESAAAMLPAITCTYPDLSPLAEPWQKSIVVGPPLADKVTGVPLDLPARLAQRPDVDVVLVEADGSKMRPVKAPAAHEPALPDGATLVVPVAGMDALHGRIADVAHRPELVARLLGKAEAEPLTVQDLATLLTHEDAALKNVPEGARVVPTINKVASPEHLAIARRVARQILLESRIDRVLLSQTQAADPVVEIERRVTAVVLAAGQSQRMGRSKQLLSWGETTILGRTLRNLNESAVFDVLAITGAEAESVAAVAEAEGVASIYNENYASGEMLSSLKTAVAQLPENRSAVLVMLADQPMVTAPIIDQLLNAYARGSGTIIAPEYEGRRGNPVLIDRTHFPELLALPTGSAPRDLLRRHPVTRIPVSTAAVLRDIDSIDDYNRYRP
jgi:molybdenum cofactor cytidylyltransferase